MCSAKSTNNSWFQLVRAFGNGVVPGEGAGGGWVRFLLYLDIHVLVFVCVIVLSNYWSLVYYFMSKYPNFRAIYQVPILNILVITHSRFLGPSIISTCATGLVPLGCKYIRFLIQKILLSCSVNGLAYLVFLSFILSPFLYYWTEQNRTEQ